MSSKTRLESPLTPPPLATFSPGIRKAGFVQVSGQWGADAHGEFASLDDIGAQTTQALLNVLAILEEAGATLDDVIMMRCYLTTRDDFAAFNMAYLAFMADRLPSGILPARTTVFVGLPFPEMLVEIDALAVLEG